eukprot:CAMPEP_0194202886 /NCGR_PEP_ID=MMETSP0156-20130528/2810_1 /TAXON_ID=33649 /ORGANISM="Thalassionema nitzschioides, Strain L26-B" /LENGTH=93 /DNA_ID=CAMNT_0038928503 /DNA_START=160 /DNA_END=441 /DNA_ORIENTATION=-
MAPLQTSKLQVSSFSTPSSGMSHTGPLFGEEFNKSKAGSRRGRLDKLAELEEDIVETDKSFVIQAVGGFVGLLFLILIIGFASGAFDQLIMNT